MKYQKVQGFRVYETWSYQTNIATDLIIRTQYIDLIQGELFMKIGFCFEPSGPTFKTKNLIAPSCVHDGLYNLMCHGLLSHKWKSEVDKLFREMCLERDMSEIRAKWIYEAVDEFGDSSIDKSNRMKILIAP